MLHDHSCQNVINTQQHEMKWNIQCVIIHDAFCFLFVRHGKRATKFWPLCTKRWSASLGTCFGILSLDNILCWLNPLSSLTGNQWVFPTCTAQWSAVLKSLSTSVGSAPFCSKACTCSGRLWKDAQWSAVIPYQDKCSHLSFNMLVINCEATYSS